jgi:predicted PurR-regulated permease PerM
MKFTGTVVTVIVVCVTLVIVVPLLTKLVNTMFLPAVVGAVLYLVVRIVHAYLDRW